MQERVSIYTSAYLDLTLTRLNFHFLALSINIEIHSVVIAATITQLGPIINILRAIAALPPSLILITFNPLS